MRVENLRRSAALPLADAASQNAINREQITTFLRWALKLDYTVGIEAYRLLSGFMHRRLVGKISDALTVSIDDSMVIGSQRFFPSDLDGEGAVFGRELMYGKLCRKRYHNL
jgi:hypothetical protein